MYVPRTKKDEVMLLRRYGNDLLRLPEYYRAFYRMTLRQRHNALWKANGRCWQMPVERSMPCPYCDTGRKMANQSKLSLFCEDSGKAETGGLL